MRCPIDATSGRCPLVLEMQDLTVVENTYQRTKTVGNALPIVGECDCSGVCWDCSSHTNVVLGGINIGSDAVHPFRQCRTRAAITGVVRFSRRQIQELQGRHAGLPSWWRWLQVVRAHALRSRGGTRDDDDELRETDKTCYR